MPRVIWIAWIAVLVAGMGTCSPEARAQAVLYGRVTDEAGEELSGVHVRVEGTEHGTATTEEGRYRLEGLSTERHEVVVSAVGFREVQEEVFLEPKEEHRLDVSLDRMVIEGEEAVVTGTMRKTRVKDTPVKVSAVDAERLQQGKTSANLMDLIGSVGGLSTQLNCGVCGTNAIRINGVEGPNTAVLIDGMPIMGALASVYGLNGISPSIIDRVEVIKGPQSTLYGTQALGGVVNILTKDPTYTPTVSADVYGQSRGEGNVHVAASPDLGRVEGFVSGNLLRMERYFDDNGDGFADVPKRSRVALFGKGVLAGANGEHRLSVAAKMYREDRTGGTADFTDDMRGSDDVYGESIYTHRAELLTEYRPPGIERHLHLRGALTYHDQDSYYGTEHYVGEQRIAVGQATWNQSLSERLHFLSGTTLRYEVYDDNTPATTEPDRRFIPGVFAQGEVEWGDVTTLGGIRLDHHAEHGYVTAPRLSAKYSPSDRTTVRANAGTGFRVVNVFTEDHAALTGAREVVFREDLEPERSRSLTASAEHIFPLGANPLTVRLDGFYTRFSNKIIPDYDRDPDLIVYDNLEGRSVTRGASIELDQNLTVLPLSYDASVTVMDVFTEQGDTRRAVAYAPSYTGSMGAAYQWRDPGVEVEYTGRVTGPKRMPDLYVEAFGRDRWSPAHTTHDVKLTKTFGDVNASGLGFDTYLSVENVFDFTQGSPLVAADRPFSDAFDTIYTWGPMVGRTISIGVRVNVR